MAQCQARYFVTERKENEPKSMWKRVFKVELHSPIWVSENVPFLLGTFSPSSANSIFSLNIVFVNSDPGLALHLSIPALWHIVRISLPWWHHSLEGKWILTRFNSPSLHPSWFSILVLFYLIDSLATLPRVVQNLWTEMTLLLRPSELLGMWAHAVWWHLTVEHISQPWGTPTIVIT